MICDQLDDLRTPENPATPARSQLLNRQPGPTTAAQSTFSSRPTPQTAQVNLLSMPSNPPTCHQSSTPVPSGSHQFRNMVGSDSDTQPRLSAADKGKGLINSYTPMVEDEDVSDQGEIFRGSVTPTPHVVMKVVSFPDQWKSYF